jgi:hypothetical protein
MVCTEVPNQKKFVSRPHGPIPLALAPTLYIQTLGTLLNICPENYAEYSRKRKQKLSSYDAKGKINNVERSIETCRRF